eukprot:TRINITY_DN1524_c0_g1_i1.p1 TRINITY_DN1524_c0_g1~~TRINITY_DN1524_c0_g1_i1.p1  ORF type:complete len:477 (+),score=144.90 TRINITY_DN1524_c0_g1_i1:119-1549(+)
MTKLNIENINQNAVKTEYAVRGVVPMRAEELKKELLNTNNGLKFGKIIPCNIGNPQALNQKPISYFRDILSLVNNERLLNSDNVDKIFDMEVIEQARQYRSEMQIQTGAYTHSQGLESFRQRVCTFIEQRDGLEKGSVSTKNIFLSDGASPIIQIALNILIKDNNTGIMLPIPQYPLYSASVTLLGGKIVPYYLEEETGWSLGNNICHVISSYEKAISEGVDVKAVVVINPGNPTGSIFTKAEMKQLVEFCETHELVLFADEVYQENIYDDELEFISFRSIITEMNSQIPLFSFHSTSKGFFGECGRRGGYGEILNVPEDIHALFYKLSSVKLCPNIDGQLATAVMVSPPNIQEYVEEVEAIKTSLKRRAEKMTQFWNSLEGVSCQKVAGSMYAFPNINIPTKAIEIARSKGMEPDLFYALELLENTGVCCVPGCGFVQKPDTYHLRCTILPLEESFDEFLGRIEKFHNEFLQKYL